MSDFIVAVLSHKSSQYWMYTTVHMVCCTGIYHFLRFLVHSLLFTAVLKTAGCGRIKKGRTKNEARLIFSSDRLALFNDGNDPAAFHPILFPPPSFYFVWLLPPPSPPLRAQEKGPTEMQRFFPLLSVRRTRRKEGKTDGLGGINFSGPASFL